jgi:aldehyde dehydrogenase (NAD+)
MATLTAPILDDISAETARRLVEKQRRFFETRQTQDIEFRIKHLRALQEAIHAQEKPILEALYNDFRKCAFEGYVTEVGFVLDDLKHTLKHLRAWAKPERVGASLMVMPASAKVYSVPYGVSLIISPWNYPFQLLIAPFVGAIAAGNCAVLKPSELAPHTSVAIANLIKSVFPEEYASVVEGGVETNMRLLEQKWDYIFFTGGTEIGRIVAQAAAKNLTPTTLELGGKSPCFVDKHANLDVAARRIVWGKYLNAGQTCVAPDYLLLDKAIEQTFLEKMRATVREFYGENPEQSADYPRIINDRHFARLKSYLSDGDIFTGGETNAAERYIAPTILRNVDASASVMQDEIFGPILPVMTYSRLDEAIDFVNQRSKPLALYVFSENSDVQNTVLANTSSGGGCVNDTVTHLTVPGLPFGGVGDSGIGGYHGKHSFDTFSHKRGILSKPSMFDIKLRYAPYAGKLKWLRKIIG